MPENKIDQVVTETFLKAAGSVLERSDGPEKFGIKLRREILEFAIMATTRNWEINFIPPKPPPPPPTLMQRLRSLITGKIPLLSRK